jgi:hypothetical protein
MISRMLLAIRFWKISSFWPSWVASVCQGTGLPPDRYFQEVYRMAICLEAGQNLPKNSKKSEDKYRSFLNTEKKGR